jgi:hypothetical protein
MGPMRTPDAVREKVRTRWSRQWRQWLGGGGQWPEVFSLDAPNQAQAQAAWPQFQAWLAAWTQAPLGGELTLQPVRWPRLGNQQLPTHLSFASAAQITQALGPGVASEFERANRRWEEAVAAWPHLAEPLRQWADYLARLNAEDFARFQSAFTWLVAHPDSGLLVRQIPVEGLHSKWIESHAAALASLLAAHRGAERTGSLLAVAGLASEAPRRRIRLLDPRLRAAVGGLHDLSLPLPELARLSVRPTTVLVVENNQSAIACGDLDDTLLIFGGGFAVNELGAVPWLADTRLLYWGDIDTAGLAILHSLRTHWPQTRSVMMDEATLLAFPALWSADDTPIARTLATLTSDEARLYQDLLQARFGPSVRLEQERIPWAHAWQTLQHAITLRAGAC